MRRPKVLIIGGGLGGISAALSLSALDYSVEIFEKNKFLGGKLYQTEEQGFIYETGPSILTMPHVIEKLFTIHNRKLKNYVDLERTEPDWRCFFPDKKVIDLFSDPSRLCAVNDCVPEKELFNLIKYNRYCRKMGKLVEKTYFKQGLESFWQVLKSYGVLNSLRGMDYLTTMNAAVEGFLDNEYLKTIFNNFSFYVGSSPFRAPAVFNLLPYIQFEYGIWYVSGGLSRLIEALQKLMTELDIKIHTTQEVKRVQVAKEDNTVTGLILQDGSQITGDIIVSNMEVIPFYRDLISDKRNNKLLNSYKEKYEPSCSGYELHLGVDRKYPDLNHHNFFFSADQKQYFNSVFEKYKLPSDPTVYLAVPSRTDLDRAPSGGEIFKILVQIPHLGRLDYSQDDFNKLKSKIIQKLENMGVQDLNEHIVFSHEILPRDIRNISYSYRGSMYGVVSDSKKNKGFKAPRRSELYDNLFFVGASVNPGGSIPMVILSGQKTAKMIKEKIN